MEIAVPSSLKMVVPCYFLITLLGTALLFVLGFLSGCGLTLPIKSIQLVKIQFVELASMFLYEY